MLNFDWLAGVSQESAKMVFLVMFVLIGVVILFIPNDYIFQGIEKKRQALVEQPEIMGHWCFGLVVFHLLYILDKNEENYGFKEKSGKLKNAQINKALGLFILFFGIVVIVAMVFTNTRIQQMTDLVAGLILCAIGGGMMLRSRKTMKSLK